MNLMCDITSNCNLRCPFCVNDWTQIRGNVNMSQEMFGRALELAASDNIGAEGFFISCAFEPLIHPDWQGLFAMVPMDLKRKAFISTNLTSPLTDDQIAALSGANLSHINVSLESLRPDLYEWFRRGATHDVFGDNLTRLSFALSANPDGPRLRLITMLFRQNAAEIGEIVTYGREELGAERHEVRTPFGFSLPLMSEEFREASLLTALEARDLSAQIDGVDWRIDDMRVESDGRGLPE